MGFKIRALCMLSIYCSNVYAFANGTAVDGAFDYVVVGGGTAGIPLGTRLAEAGYKVAIVEAGGFYEDSEPIITTTPAFDFTPNAANDWGFVTTPQAGMNGRSVAYPRGKCLGGTSARNAMIYQRGPTGSFQKWADEVGDESYILPKFERYFKKSVKFTPPNVSKRAANATPGYNTAAFSASGGPLTVSYANWAAPFSSWVKLAMSAVGITDAGDFDSGDIMGSQYFQTTMVPGSQERASSENTYLAACHDVPNLTVFKHTLGKRIMFDDQKKAIGVLVQTSGISYFLKAHREVVVSAGTFQSPQMLMVSGIGPSATLVEHGIPVLYDNPHVGQNMIDHTWFGPAYRVKVETTTRWTNEPFYMLEQFVGPYQQHREGPITSNGGDFGAFEKIPEELRSKFTAAALKELDEMPEDWPEVEYVVAPSYLGDFQSPQPTDGYQYASVAAALMAPMSRGNVSIRSNDTSDLPVINPNIFTSLTDQEVAVAAYKRMRQIFQSPELAPVLIGGEYFPGPKVRTDEELLAHLKQNCMVYYHAGSSCAMGNPNAPGNRAVVDSEAKVIGVEGLRVVDASVLPFLIPSHIQSALYALAEKIADEIIEGNSRFMGGIQLELKR